MADSYEPILKFDTDEAEFMRGFECGRIWAMLDGPFDEFKLTLHTANAEMVLRIVEAKPAIALNWVELGDGWAEARFRRVE